MRNGFEFVFLFHRGSDFGFLGVCSEVMLLFDGVDLTLRPLNSDLVSAIRSLRLAITVLRARHSGLCFMSAQLARVCTHYG